MTAVLDRETSTKVLVPRDYQIFGTQFLLDTRRAFLCDWPGLGKTLTAAEACVGKSLISAPNHLAEQWYEFLQNQYPHENIVWATGSRKQREELLKTKGVDRYVVNIQMLKSYKMPDDIQTYVFDESHHLRNRTARQSLAADKWANRDPNSNVYMVTASPMWKSLDDIWMQLHILYPDIIPPYRRFVELFFITVASPYGDKVVGVKRAMRAELEKIISPIKLGRTYADVGRQLPPVIENVIKFPMREEHRKIYDGVIKEYKIKYGGSEDDDEQTILFSASGLVHTLRQITMETGKLEVIKAIIEDNKTPSVIFWWYKDHAKQCAQAIENTVCITGDMDGSERRRVAERAMNTGQNISATIASLTEGVNLHKYRQVIHGEEHWPPGSNYQALSRVVRDRNDDGKDVSPVLVYYILARHTIDEGIHRITRRRQASIKDLIKEAMV